MQQPLELLEVVYSSLYNTAHTYSTLKGFLKACVQYAENFIFQKMLFTNGWVVQYISIFRHTVNTVKLPNLWNLLAPNVCLFSPTGLSQHTVCTCMHIHEPNPWFFAATKQLVYRKSVGPPPQKTIRFSTWCLPWHGMC